jgi:hypothetical protein
MKSEGFVVKSREALTLSSVPAQSGLRKYGATRRDRTGDLLITNPVLPIMADVGRGGFRMLSIS